MKRWVCTLSLVALSGCYKVRVDGLSLDGGPGTKERRLSHSVLWGLVTFNTVDAKRLCGDKGVWAVESKMSGLTLLANWLTVGLYSPLKVTVTCKG